MAKFKVPLSVRLESENELIEKRLEKLSYRIRVACPGFIKSFDEIKQTVSVKLAIRERLSFNGSPFEDIDVPILQDVPIFMPRAGKFVLTMPVTIGDECLVVFGDNCIDSWWQSGIVGDQMDNRRHDLSDGFAILGVWSQPKVISSFSTDSAFLRNLANNSYIEVRENDINIVTSQKVTITAGSEVEVNAPTVDVNATTVTVDATKATITASSGVSLDGSGLSEIDSKNFLNHAHSGVEPGAGNTGGVI